MNRIPPEIDSLIWQIADKAEPDAVYEFTNRYPAYRSHLMNRIATVRALRESSQWSPAAVPAFIYPKAVPAWPKLVAAGAALTVFALASYLGTMKFTKQHTDEQAVSLPPRATSKLPKRALRRLQNGQQTFPVPEAHVPSFITTTPLNVPRIRPAVTVPIAPKPISFHAPRAQLKTILEAVAEEGNFKIHFEGEIPDQEVQVDYDRVTPFDILADLGDEYGFSVVDEGSGTLVILPKPPPDPANAPN